MAIYSTIHRAALAFSAQLVRTVSMYFKCGTALGIANSKAMLMIWVRSWRDLDMYFLLLFALKVILRSYGWRKHCCRTGTRIVVVQAKD